MASNEMIVTVVGSGTSQGIPVIACHCTVCKSDNKKDHRLRSSIHIQHNDKSIVIDTGPDFRQQMLQNQIEYLDAVLFTHEHKDHVAGLDDVRPYNFKQKKPVDIYCSNRVFEALKREYIYIFDPKFKYPGIPQINRISIDKNSTIQIGNTAIKPVEVMHYKLPVLGFRMNNFAYITDAKTISDEEKEKIKDLDVLIINALRKEEHISHLNLEQAIEMINDLSPKKAYLTHISHHMGLHEEIESSLPENIKLAYDGLQIKLP